MAFKSAKPGAGLSLCTEISLPINPPHIHAEYQGHEALVEISTGHILEGGLPKKAAKLVGDWCLSHQTELADNWQRAMDFQPLERIAGADND